MRTKIGKSKAAPRRRWRPVTNERIEQIMTDLHEGIDSGTARELREVAVYQSNLRNAAEIRLGAVRADVAALVLGSTLVTEATRALGKWLNDLTAAEQAPTPPPEAA